MSVEEITGRLIQGMKDTTITEYVAVIFGIISVIFSRRENVWVYPTGLINTILYIYLCYGWKLYAEASVNIFYTIMSLYGWYLWTRKTDTTHGSALQITKSDKKQWLLALGFFVLMWASLFLILRLYSDSDVPLADSFAGASAYTGMLLMARKKIESWIWWMITNIASIPLYFYKGAVFTSFQYIVFLVLAVMGFITWRNKIKARENTAGVNIV